MHTCIWPILVILLITATATQSLASVKPRHPEKGPLNGCVCVCNLNVNNVNDKRNHPLVNTKSSRLTIVFFSSSASRHDVCVLNPVTVTIVTQIVLDLKVITVHKSIHFCIRNNVRTDTILTIHSNQKKIFAGYVIQKLFKISFRIEQTC